MRNVSEYQQNREEILASVITASKERDARQQWIDDPDFDQKTLDWIVYERNVYHDTINAIRARKGFGPVPRAEILKAERQASGHVDYGKKLSIYGADLCQSEEARLRGPF